MIDGLTFDAAKHEYRFKGVVVPSVTQLLKPLEDWSFLDEEAKAFYAGRGTAVHQATALDDQNDLDEASVDPQIAGYVNSWRHIRLDKTIQILSCEEFVYHPLLRVAGTLDRRLMINDTHCILDIKAGVKLATHGIQVYGYKKLWNHERPFREQVRDCYTAYLMKDGSPAKLVKWPDPMHEQMFVALLTMKTWSDRYAPQ